MNTQLALAGHEQPIAYGEADWWPTPTWLADRMIEWAGLRAGESVLEPSAGDGALVAAAYRRLRALGDQHPRITAVELRHERERALRAAGADEVVLGDWPTVAATWRMGDRPAFDITIANPPFSLVAAHLYPMVCAAQRAVVLLPLTALEGQERHREVWSRVHLLRFRVLVSRPRFGGHTSPATAYCVAEITRRNPGEARVRADFDWWT